MPQDFAAAMVSTPDEIPVIDISGAIAGDGVAGVATALHRAAVEHGFFYVSGHGIDPVQIEAAFSVARRFFALPAEAKQSVAVNIDQRGWMAQGMSHLAGAKTHDLKEVFFWGAELPPDDPDILAGKPLCAQNQWPDAVFPDLRADLTPYYRAVCSVGATVMSALAVGLGLPDDQFRAAYAKPLARGQLVYYPQSTARDEAEERFGVAPHTDFGVLTLLLQDDSGGLQVLVPSGDWIEAPPIPGTLVCNIGDLLARWTNNRLKSTVHRVINRSGAARYSIPVFYDPHTDTAIDPVDLGVPSDASKFAPVRAGEHIMRRNTNSFAQYKSEAS